ncbi:MAG TPA: hypothetical protein VGR78_18250 [Verrucomicrobiae bacterium]|nr:hypothetical protein [Verrucomicrobiae bacterium]
MLDDGNVIVAHAGMKKEMQSRGPGGVREFPQAVTNINPFITSWLVKRVENVGAEVKSHDRFFLSAAK